MRLYVWVLMAAVIALAAGCAKEERPDGGEPSVNEVYITDSTQYDGFIAYDFVYPSKDPYGEEVMLSGTITLGNDVKAQRYAKGLLLYNHFTVYRADQCPSRGWLTEQKYASTLNLITISPDYYGFGSTEGRNQAYCISQTNAQASVDALLAAKVLLTEMGYRWGDLLFNGGYSQGGQTSMGVVRLVAEKYPEIDITYSFIGAGSYDIPETYRQFVTARVAGMPSTVVSVMLAYNEFKEVGLTREEMLKEPVLSHVDEWILSKRYTREEIDAMIGSLSVEDYVAEGPLDTTSAVSHRLMAAMEEDNICRGWTPRGDEKLMLYHSRRDITVPVENTENMYNYLVEHGVPEENIDLMIEDVEGTEETPAHEAAATNFVFYAMLKVMSLMN